MMPAFLANWLIARAKRTPYFHLHAEDGTTYMERYWLVPYRGEGSASDTGCYTAKWRSQPFTRLLQSLGVAIRVQHIMRGDLDRHMHDHPWSFISVVLKDWYREARPKHPGFFAKRYKRDEEIAVHTLRKQGSIAFRRVGQRHRIAEVSPGGVVTLFITFRYRQPWGFYTPSGKVPWREYLDQKEVQQ